MAWEHKCRDRRHHGSDDPKAFCGKHDPNRHHALRRRNYRLDCRTRSAGIVFPRSRSLYRFHIVGGGHLGVLHARQSLLLRSIVGRRASMVLIGYGSVENPLGSFQFGVAWGSAILLAVVVDALVHSLLWPTTTATIFEEQLRANTENCRDLLRLMVETFCRRTGQARGYKSH